MKKLSTSQRSIRLSQDPGLLACLFLAAAVLLMLLAVSQSPQVVLLALATALMALMTRVMGKRLCADLLQAHGKASDKLFNSGFREP